MVEVKIKYRADADRLIYINIKGDDYDVVEEIIHAIRETMGEKFNDYEEL